MVRSNALHLKVLGKAAGNFLEALVGFFSFSEILSLASKIAKDWRVADLVPHPSEKGGSREGEGKKRW